MKRSSASKNHGSVRSFSNQFSCPSEANIVAKGFNSMLRKLKLGFPLDV